MELMAKEALSRMFEGVPFLDGNPTVGKLMLSRMKKEVNKLNEADLDKYLQLLELLGHAIRTGEGFDTLMSEGPSA